MNVQFDGMQFLAQMRSQREELARVAIGQRREGDEIAAMMSDAAIMAIDRMADCFVAAIQPRHLFNAVRAEAGLPTLPEVM